MNVATAQAIIDRVSTRRREVVALAAPLALAARIEPELLRKARLLLLPGVDASVEADLWFSPLVQSYSPLALVFIPEVAHLLRQRLAQDQQQLQAAYDLLCEYHATAPPAIQAEEAMTWLALSQEPDKAQQIKAQLLSILQAMSASGGRNVARWFLRALPRLPDTVRSTPLARLMEFGAAVRLNLTRTPPGGSSEAELVEWLPAVAPPTLPSTIIGVWLSAAGVELGEPTPAGHTIDAPQTDPILLGISWQEPSGWQSILVHFRHGEPQTIPVPAATVEVETTAGKRWQLSRTEPTILPSAVADPQQRIYALLVGIDTYPPDLSPLYGCVNDIRRFATFLQSRLAQPERLRLQLLINEQATRQAVIDGFRRHLRQASSGDLALFYFSGYGSQALSPPEFWPMEADRLDETLVCWDSRQPGQWDLADKELKLLVDEVAAKGARPLLILDCAHTGSGTQTATPDRATARVRRAPTDSRLRPSATFLGASGEAKGAFSPSPVERLVNLTACRAEEDALELDLGGEARGVFSYFLLTALQQGGTQLPYRQLLQQISTLVQVQVAGQSPQLTSGAVDLDYSFLNGALAPAPPTFTLRYDQRSRTWMIDGGAVHGLPAPVSDETTVLAVFPFDSSEEQRRNLAGAYSMVRVTQRLSTCSVVEVLGRINSSSGKSSLLNAGVLPRLGEDLLDTNAVYRAVVTTLPLPPLRVHLAGEAAALALVRSALNRRDPDDAPVFSVRETTLAEADLILQAEEGVYRIQRTDGTSFFIETPSLYQEGVQWVVQQVAHIVRWRQLLTLANPLTELHAEDIRLEILYTVQGDPWLPPPGDPDVRLVYTFNGSNWQPPTFKVKLTNTSQRRLFCMLFDLAESYSVTPLLPEGGLWLKPGEEAWVNNGDPRNGIVPDQQWQEGVVAMKETLKLIVSTEEADATLLQQEELPVTLGRTGPRRVGANAPWNTLGHLIAQVQQQSLIPLPDPVTWADWRATAVSFTLVRPQEAVAIAPSPGGYAILRPGVSVQSHPQLQGQARLTSLALAGRDLGNLTLPAILRDYPALAQPFALTGSRGGAAGLSVLELLAVTDHMAVNPTAPLVVQCEQPLAATDLLLPLGWDGQFFLPLGHVQRTNGGVTVPLERLPAPNRNGTHDLSGSIKILFQRLLNQRLPQSASNPRLRIATVSSDGTVTYSPDGDLASVRVAVAEANTVLLLIHGLTGDTQFMAAGTQTTWLNLATPAPSLQERYDLLLTFDYESLYTSIEENARLLQERLAAVGLSAKDGKTLHVVAHTTGGLVARWFIERERGNQVVQRLVMLGTPNGGVAWPTLNEWTTFALAVALNNLWPTRWPLALFAALVATLEQEAVTLDQTQPGAELLKMLADSPDPGVPYTVIAGVVALQAAALEPRINTKRSLGEELWVRLQSGVGADGSAMPPFLAQSGDLFATVESMRALNSVFRSVHFVEVPCDSLSYFSDEASLRILAEQLSAWTMAVA